MKRMLTVISVVAVLAVLLSAGVRAAQPAAAAARPAALSVGPTRDDGLPSYCNTACVVFYYGPDYNIPPHCGNFCGGIAAAFTSSQADLSGWSVGGHIESIQLADVPSIAVYSQANYGGICQTIIANMPSMSASAVGNDQVASFKINATCDGPLASGVSPLPFLTDVAPFDGSFFPTNPCSQAGYHGWVWRWGDLNTGTGAADLSLCLRFSGDPSVPPFNPVLVTTSTQADVSGCFDVSPSGAPQPLALCSIADPGTVTLDLESVVVPHGVAETQQVCSYSPAPNFGIFFDPTDNPTVCTTINHVVTAETGAQACHDAWGSNYTLVTQPGGVGLNDLNRGLGDYSVYLCAEQVQVSTSAPSITPTVLAANGGGSVSPSSSGWYNTDVQVSWNVGGGSASGSGCDPTSITQDTAGTTLTCTVTSFGNTTSQSVTIKRDSTPPVITAAATTADGKPYTAGTWTNQPVTVTFTCEDTGTVQSGIATNTIDGPHTLSTEAAGVTLLSSGDCIDNAGNSAYQVKFGPILIDLTKPVISGTAAPAPNASGWNNTDVTVNFTCADTGSVQSGIATNSLTSVTLANDGANQTAKSNGSCVDKAGNSADAASVGGINIDTTAPTTTATPNSQPNAAGWYQKAVTVSLSGADALSGVAGSTYNLDNQGWLTYSQPVTVSADGKHTLQYRSTDKAGNQEQTKTLTLNIDTTAPTLACSASPTSIWPPNHKQVAVTVSVTVSDSLTGAAGFTLQSATASASSSDIQGFIVGQASTSGSVAANKDESYTLTYQGKDVAGNTAVCTVTVSVPHDPGNH